MWFCQNLVSPNWIQMHCFYIRTGSSFDSSHYSRFGWFLSQNPKIGLFTFLSISLAEIIEHTRELHNWTIKPTFERIDMIKSGLKIGQNWAFLPFQSNLTNRARQKMFFKTHIWIDLDTILIESYVLMFNWPD